jgi:general secretion pathway protein G
MKYKHANLDHSEAGWTFMETLIVIAIVLILTSSVGFMAIQYLDKARIATARSQIDSFCVALESYYIDNGRYPSEEQGLKSLWAKPSIEPISDKWKGPYMYKEVPKDPWGNEYIYTIPGSNGLPFELASLGADAKQGGEGNDADISSWKE